MKVLLINATFGNGSTGNIVRDIQETCKAKDIDCKVAYAYSSTPQKEIDGWHIGNWTSNKLHALFARINGKEGYFSYFSTLNLIRKIKIYKPDVINIHNLHSNFVNLGMLLKYISKTDINLIVTLHDCWYFTGGCFHYTSVGCDKWMTNCKDCPKKMRDTKAYFKDCAAEILRDRYKWFGGIKNLTCVGVSNWITSQAQKTVFKKAKCLTIHNGIDTSIFKPTETNLKKLIGLENKIVILGPASKWLDPINRQLLEEVSTNLKEDQILLLFGYRGRGINLRNIQTFEFTTDKSLLAKLFSLADLFANCSREDTLSTINIEAQACGTPIVTYDNTGSKETAHPFLSTCVKTGDIRTMSQQIIGVTRKDSATSRELHDWVKEEFNKAKNYKIYNALIRNLENTHK